jgi:glycerate dehydrogenase
MKIVVFDGYTVNPGDLDWNLFREFGEFDVHDRTPSTQIIERARGAQILLTNKTVLSAETLANLPDLLYIGVLATGYNVVDLRAASARGIIVTNVPAYSTRSVAQMTFALLLELTQRVAMHSESVHQGKWGRCPDFCFWDQPLTELDGRIMGLMGYGNIGRAVGKIADAFGMKQIVYTPRPKIDSFPEIEWVSLEDLFRRSDVLSLHCPLTDENQHVVNADRIRLMKSTAYLINTSRGPLVDPVALADALNENRIAGAGLDVLEIEPPVTGNPLVGVPNCLITPHIGWATKFARQRLLEVAAGNVEAFLKKKPINVVNGI